MSLSILSGAVMIQTPHNLSYYEILRGSRVKDIKRERQGKRHWGKQWEIERGR